MKRVLAVILSFLLCLSLTGCRSVEVKMADRLISGIGQVDIHSADAIARARNAYDALSEDDKAQILHYDQLIKAEAGYVDALIAAIGEVTVESGPAITAAQEAYDALCPEAKAEVTGMDVLTQAKADYAQALEWKELEAFRLSLAGVWVHEVIGKNVLPRAMEDTNCHPVSGTAWTAEGGANPIQCTWFELMPNGTVMAEHPIGTWKITKDKTAVIMEGYYSEGNPFLLRFALTQEDGFPKLIGAVLDNPRYAFVREEDYSAAFDAKYVAVDLTAENFRDYIGDPVATGDARTPGGGIMHTFIYPTQAFDDGLVYLGCACSVTVSAVIDGRPVQFSDSFPVYCGWENEIRDLRLGNAASGQMYYIRSSHVVNNYVNDRGVRILELTNGIQLSFDGYGAGYDDFWSRVNVNYRDYIY